MWIELRPRANAVAKCSLSRHSCLVRIITHSCYVTFLKEKARLLRPIPPLRHINSIVTQS